jgi:hypothetical protein
MERKTKNRSNKISVVDRPGEKTGHSKRRSAGIQIHQHRPTGTEKNEVKIAQIWRNFKERNEGHKQNSKTDFFIAIQTIFVQFIALTPSFD